MNNINSIINLKKYPINNKIFIKNCKIDLQNKSILILKNFLKRDALKNILIEAHKLEDKAFYCNQKHTILLTKKNSKKDKLDPLNIEVISDKGCVPHDLIKKSSPLNVIYNSNIFKEFLVQVLNLKKIYPYKDNLSSINYNYYQKNQQLGWHFDNASFAITLMIQSPNKGGEFEYINKGRDYNLNYIDKKFVNKVIKGKADTFKLDVSSGTLVLFFGRNYLHRVTPVRSKKSRILVTLNYNEENNIKLSANARLTFFGRLN